MGMLQSSILEPLLTQTLNETPEITPLVPYFVSLVSNESQKALVSYISNHQHQHQQKHQQQQKLIDVDITTTTTTATPPPSTTTNGVSNGDYMMGQHPGYLNQQNDKPKSKIDDIQDEIDMLNNLQYSDDYINSDVDPKTLLNYLSLLVIKQWCQYLQQNQESHGSIVTQAYEHGSYRFYLHEVNSKYSVMVCCSKEYPSVLAVGKLENLCKVLEQKI